MKRNRSLNTFSATTTTPVCLLSSPRCALFNPLTPFEKGWHIVLHLLVGWSVDQKGLFLCRKVAKLGTVNAPKQFMTIIDVLVKRQG